MELGPPALKPGIYFRRQRLATTIAVMMASPTIPPTPGAGNGCELNAHAGFAMSVIKAIVAIARVDLRSSKDRRIMYLLVS